jgi:hypothetical protein
MISWPETLKKNVNHHRISKIKLLQFDIPAKKEKAKVPKVTVDWIRGCHLRSNFRRQKCRGVSVCECASVFVSM